MASTQVSRIVCLRGFRPPGSLPRRPWTPRRVYRLANNGFGAVTPVEICSAKKEQFDSDQLEHFSFGDSDEISDEEWEAIKRVADRLFPEGLMDWDAFWTGANYPAWFQQWCQLLEQEGDLNPSLPQYEASLMGQSAWMRKALMYLSTRPDYQEPVDDDWARSEQEVEEEINYGKEFDPDWDDLDFYAMMQKRKARERERRAWRRQQREEVGKYRYVDTISLDIRISEEQRKAYEWTDEEVWDLITQKGRAFDPRKEKGPWIEMNPDEVPDWAAEGNEYVEEIDKYLEKTGRLVESEDYFEEQNARVRSVSSVEEAFPDDMAGDDEDE